MIARNKIICPVCDNETKVKGKATKGMVYGVCGCEFYLSRRTFIEYKMTEKNEELKQ